MTRYYCATSSDLVGIGRARMFMGLAIARGHICTYDWTIPAKRARNAGITCDRDITDDQLRYQLALACIQGARDAACLVYLAPPEPSEGAAFELGIAIERQRTEKIHTIIVGSAGTVFATLASFHVDTVTQALDILDTLGREPKTHTSGG